MPPCADCKASTCWREKTKLEKILIVSLICISALALAVLCAYIVTLLTGKEKDKEKEKKSSKGDDVCLTESCIFAAQTILENMDSRIPPCEDFYNFACGNFIKETIVPENQESVSSFTVVKNSLQKQMKYLLEEPIQTNELRPFKMIKTFYKTCMNLDLIEKDGLNAIRTILKGLGGWPVLEEDKWAEVNWEELTYKFREIGFFDISLLKIYVKKDSFTSNRRVLYIDCPPSDRKKKLHKRVWTEEDVKTAYFRYMVDTAVLFGADRNRSLSELREAFIFEGNILDLANQTAGFVKINATILEQTFLNFTWIKFINKLLDPHNVKISGNEELLVDFKYLEGFIPLLQTASKRTIANYMIWRFIYYCTPFLNRALVEARLKYTRVFTGVSIGGSRWENCLDNFMVSPDISDSVPRRSLFIAVGALYVRKYVSKKIKEDAQEMISNIFRSFQDTLEHTKWMDAETRKNALDKAKAMIMNTAYPDEFLNDTKLLEFYHDDIRLDESYLKSVLKLNLFDIRHNFKRLREKPVNRKDWIEQSQVFIVNAFYDPSINSMNVPVGILQKYMFSNGRPNYLNNGAIGAIIGHEFTHGFDSTGRFFDKNGNMVDWWTPESKNSYENRTACITKQYNNYKLPELNMTVNGNRTIDENIADNGGFITSYKAYQKWVKKNGEEKLLPGLKYTQNQLFWISMANVWCSKYTPESFQYYLLTDIHAPDRFRVIGPLSNYEDFAQDFHCSAGSKMNPNQKCKLW